MPSAFFRDSRCMNSALAAQSPTCISFSRCQGAPSRFPGVRGGRDFVVFAEARRHDLGRLEAASRTVARGETCSRNRPDTAEDPQAPRIVDPFCFFYFLLLVRVLNCLVLFSAFLSSFFFLFSRWRKVRSERVHGTEKFCRETVRPVWKS